MPDFPTIGGASASQIWSYATRELTGFTGQPRTDVIGANESLNTHGYTTARAGYLDNLDAAISSRATDAGAATAVWAAGARTLTAFTGQPRTDLVGADNTLWTHATRTLTGLTGTPRSDLIGQDASLEGTTGARVSRLDNIPAFETRVETSVVMDGTEKTLVEKTDDKQGLLDGYVDLTPMQAGDTIVIRQSMIVKSAGSYAKYAEETYSGAQTIPLLHIVTKTAARSIKVTAQQTAGTNRTLDVQFFRRRQV